jgi:hypothetical protein
MTERTSSYDSTTTGRDRPSESERERARQAAEEIKSAAKDAAASTASALRNRFSGELDYRKYRSRQSLNRVASALRQAGANVDATDDSVSRYMERLADGVERTATYLDQNDVSKILHDAREMARRRPELFAGGLFVAGLMLGRFLRSSTPNETFEQDWDDYPAYAGGGGAGSYAAAGTPSQSVTTNPYSGGGPAPSTPSGADHLP